MSRSIVINREFASGGREIGRLIAVRTGMEFYDTRILQEAAAAQGLAPDLLEQFDERVVSGTYFSLGMFGGTDAETSALPFRMFSAVSKVIVEAASRAPAVFIGRCADHVLAEARIKYRSVFVYSSDTDAKTARATAVAGVDARHAEGYIARMDKARSRYQQFFTGTTFGDPHCYDLCLDSARLGYAGCADLILAAARTDPAA
jgi:hypothetical protein